MAEVAQATVPPAVEAAPPAEQQAEQQQQPEQSSDGAAHQTEAGGGGGAAAAPPEAPEASAREICFRVTFGKQSAELKRPASSTVGDLKAEVERTLGISPSNQKLMSQRKLLRNDADTLEQIGLKNGAKVLLVGSSHADIAAATQQPVGGSGGAKLDWDAPKQQEDISQQPQHQKVIAKGPPEDALPGIPDRQVPMPDSLQHIGGLLNTQGTKVRLTFKPELQQLWLASATSTQKVPMSTVSRIEAWPIAGRPGYSVVALGLGANSTSRLWLYFFPSQYVSGLKLRVLGLHSLI